MMHGFRMPLIRKITFVLVFKVLALVFIKLAFFSESTSAPVDDRQVANVLLSAPIPLNPITTLQRSSKEIVDD